MADDPQPDDKSKGDKTFTQAELEAELKKRLDRERAKYADYAEVKAKAEAADKAAEATKSDMDRLSEQVSTLTDNLAKSETARIRAEVIAEKKLTPAQAKRLTGSTREALEADADDLLESFPAAPAPDANKDADGNADDGAGSGDSASKTTPKPNDVQGQGNAGRDGGSLDPAKLADSIPRP